MMDAHHTPARILDGAAGPSGSEVRLRKPAGASFMPSKAHKPRTYHLTAVTAADLSHDGEHRP